jgi:hypothetical protein
MFVGIDDDGRFVAFDSKHEPVFVIQSVEDFHTVCEANGGSVMCSASMDFPEESTHDAAVIALCREIRG